MSKWFKFLIKQLPHYLNSFVIVSFLLNPFLPLLKPVKSWSVSASKSSVPTSQVSTPPIKSQSLATNNVASQPIAPQPKPSTELRGCFKSKKKGNNKVKNKNVSDQRKRMRENNGDSKGK